MKISRLYTVFAALLIMTSVATLIPSQAKAISEKAATSANNNVASSLTIPVPAGTTAGDVLLASIDVENSPTITLPGGWLLIRSDTNPNALHLLQADYVHVVAGAEPANYTWTFSAAHGASGGMIDYSGVDNNTPVDASSGQTTTATATQIVAPSVNASQTNDMLVAIFGIGVNRTLTVPSGMTQRYTDSTAASGEKTVIVADDQGLTAAGASGSRTAIASGSSVGIGQLVALRAAPAVNHPPVVDSVAINQTSRMTNDTLSATVSAHDPDGSAVTLSYQWVLNGFDIPGATASTLDLSQPGNGNKGDFVQLRVTASDGSLRSNPVTSQAVTIVNSPPTATVSLNTTTPDANSTLTATVSNSDADSDPVTNTFVWKVNGVVQQQFTISSTSQNSDSMDLSGYANYGDTVTVEITPNDGSVDGTVSTATAVVTQSPPANQPPIVDSVSVTPAPRLVTDSTASAQVAAHDPDGNSLTYSYQWIKNGVDIPGATNSTLDLSQPNNGDRGDQISVRVVANDGQANSVAVTSTAVTIVNSPPQATVTLSPLNPTPTSTLTATVVASDVDGDPVTFTYNWLVNHGGAIVRTVYATSATSDSLNISGLAQSGDTIEVQVIPSDSYVDGNTAITSVPVAAVSTFGTITEYSLPGSNAPSGITLGPDGNVWVTEEGNHAVAKITPAGVVTEYIVPTTGSLGGIAAGSDGNIWFTEYDGHKVDRITPSGTITRFSVSFGGAGITTGPDGNLWFSESAGNKIGRMNPLTGTLVEFNIPTTNAWPHGINPGPDGNIWFVELLASKIGKITPSGVITEYKIPTSKSNPRVIFTGPDGNLWFTEYAGNKIGRINPTTGAIVEFVVPTAASQPVGMTAGSDGNMWFTEQAGNKIGRITTSGVITEYALPTPSAKPDKITLGVDGNLWFTESNVGKIGTFSLH